MVPVENANEAIPSVIWSLTESGSSVENIHRVSGKIKWETRVSFELYSGARR